MDAFQLIEEAIRTRQQVIASFGGFEREMCPHALGWKGGKPQAMFFQFGGGSNSGLPTGGQWRCIPLSGLSNVRLRAGNWYTGDVKGTGQSTCIDQVHIQI